METRLFEVIDNATSTCLSALDNDEQATARLFIQRAAHAADESWQHTSLGAAQQGPGVAGPTTASLGHPGSASQDGDSDDMVPRKSRLGGPQLQAQLSTGHVSDGLKETPLSSHQKSPNILTERHKSLLTNSTSASDKSYAAPCKHPRKPRSLSRKNSGQSSSLISAVRTL